jgi:hypothetical protein
VAILNLLFASKGTKYHAVFRSRSSPNLCATQPVSRQGITWPTFYKWELRKQKDGCWMIENMTPEPPPIDTVATDATPLLESESATAAP